MITRIYLDKDNRMIRIGFGKNDGNLHMGTDDYLEALVKHFGDK